MIDLKINATGDLELKENIKYPSFIMDFNINKYPAFKLDFKQGKAALSQIEDNGFMLNFMTNGVKGNYRCYAIRDAEQLKQRIAVILKTELGDIKNLENFGTLIRTLKHLDITADSTLQAIHDMVYDVISSMLEEPSIKVVKRKKDGPFFCQNLDVYIYDGENELYKFEIEG